jgi:hypothetical protein
MRPWLVYFAAGAVGVVFATALSTALSSEDAANNERLSNSNIRVYYHAEQNVVCYQTNAAAISCLRAMQPRNNAETE